MAPSRNALLYEHDFATDGASMVIDVPEKYVCGNYVLNNVTGGTSSMNLYRGDGAGSPDLITRRRGYTNKSVSEVDESSVFGAAIAGIGSGLYAQGDIWNLQMAAPMMVRSYYMHATAEPLKQCTIIKTPSPTTQIIIKASAGTATAGICRVQLFKRRFIIDAMTLSSQNSINLPTGLIKKRPDVLICGYGMTQTGSAKIHWRESNDGGSTWNSSWRRGFILHTSDGVVTAETDCVLEGRAQNSNVGLWAHIMNPGSSQQSAWDAEDMSISSTNARTHMGHANTAYQADTGRIEAASGDMSGTVWAVHYER